MDLLAQYSDASGEAGAGDDDDGPTSVRPAVNIAPEVHVTGKALVTDGDQQRIVSTADVQNLHGAPRAPAPPPIRARSRPNRNPPAPSRRSPRPPFPPPHPTASLTSDLDPTDPRSHPRPRASDPAQKRIYYNAKYEDMHAPLEGPSHPFRSDGAARGARNHATGHVETAFPDRFAFDEQYNTFQARGYGAEPSGRGFVGDAGAAASNRGESVYGVNAAKRRRVRDDALAAVGGEADAAAAGNFSAWAPDRVATKVLKPEDLTEQQKEYVKWHAERREANLRARGKLKDEEGEGGAGASAGENAGAVGGDRSVFHGKEAKRYDGEAWIAPPKDRKKENDHCYAPKRCVHTWSGHTKGVQAIRFFPNHGHLLLSAGLDSKVKIWDVHNSGKCMRTYMGHDKALKDIAFTNDGTKFVSTSWDKKIKLWDTETGQVITTLTSGKIAYAVKLHPDADKQNVLMAAQADKKILQYDFNTGDVVQEYDQHLGAVNTVTFCDEGRRFVTTSDDKTVRVWEFGIPVVMKYIADPSMQSMPSVALSPNANWLAAQSMDNSIMIYSTKDKFRLNRKKRFTGHSNSGYACQVNFSPDGRFVMSGDAEGKCHFWDWKSCRIFKTLKCHDKVTIGCEWHPLEQSKVATCSWDGTIKYWD